MADIKYTDIRSSEYGMDNFNVNIFIGMRGMGKTFSALSPLYKSDDHKQKKLLCRLTIDETDILASQVGNVYKDINVKFPDHEPYASFAAKKSFYETRAYMEDEEEAGKWIPTGECVAYLCPLVTLCKICGAGFSDVNEFIIDEFIPRKNIRYNGDKFTDIMSCWETINRNREAVGQPACKLILLSNSNNIYDSVIRGFGLVSEAERMCAEGREHYFDMDRSIAFHILKPSETFSEFKQNSAVAKATKGTSYFDMAFENQFSYNDFSFVCHKNMRGWRPMCSIQGVGYLYTLGNQYHVTYRKAEVPDYRIDGIIFKKQFRRDFGFLDVPFTQGLITFESYELKELLLDGIS